MGKNLPNIGKNDEVSPANKDIAWFSAARNEDLSRCELESVLGGLNDFVKRWKVRGLKLMPSCNCLKHISHYWKKGKVACWLL